MPGAVSSGACRVRPNVMPTIESLLNDTNLPHSSRPRLSVELLLAHALEKPRSFLHTWPERVPTDEQCQRFAGYLQRRRQGEPVAYILGRQGFWNLDLEVAAHTLIPRPDTELLVETALQLLPATAVQVLDLGTRSEERRVGKERGSRWAQKC